MFILKIRKYVSVLFRRKIQYSIQQFKTISNFSFIDLALRTCANVVEAVDPSFSRYYRIGQNSKQPDPRINAYTNIIDDLLENEEEFAAFKGTEWDTIRKIMEDNMPEPEHRLFSFMALAEGRIRFALSITGKHALFQNLPIDTLEFGETKSHQKPLNEQLI